MSVRKLRAIGEAETAAWRDPYDPNFWNTVSALWRFARRVAPASFPPGLHKSRSIEELNERTNQWARDAADRA